MREICTSRVLDVTCTVIRVAMNYANLQYFIAMQDEQRATPQLAKLPYTKQIMT